MLSTGSRAAARLATGIRPSAAIWRSGIPLAAAPVSPFHTTVATRASDKTMKIQDPFAQNEKLGRPMSPHLTIYSWQLTNTLSILNRATAGAIGLVFYDYFAMYALAPGALGGAAAVSAAASVPVVLFAGKAVLATSFWYHFWAGIRHYVWDLGYLLDLKGVYSTGYAAAGATVLCTLATLMI